MMEEANNDVDRISILPNDVVAYILSFMSIEDAVRTCILAKRWRNAWAFVPVLDFNYSNISCPYYTARNNNYMCKFERFVRGVVVNMEISHVDIFRLCIDFCNSDQILQALCNLILHAMKFKPRVCDIILLSFQLVNLDTDLIFNCASLHHLVLSLRAQQGRTTISPKSINLPYLKSLNFQDVTITEDFIKKLLLGCTILEKLVLTCCDLQFTKISSNTLKELNLNYCSPKIGENVQIVTPNLVHFAGYMSGVSLQNMPSLACANIQFAGCSYRNQESITSSPRLLNCLSNATTLCVGMSRSELEVWSKDIPYCKTFNNLESLTLGGCYFGDDFKLVRFFLQNSPKLRALNLSYDDESIGDILEDTSLEKGDVSIRRVYLGTVEIVMWEKQESSVDFLMQELFCHVKPIGEINKSSFL